MSERLTEEELEMIRKRVFELKLEHRDLDDAIVTDGHPEHIRCQILQSRHPVSNRLTVDDPGLVPDIGRHLVKHGWFERGTG